MRGALLCLATLAVALAAGCIGSPGEPMTMREGLGDARDAAAAWGSSPQLLGAFAIEPFKHLRDTDEEGRLEGEFVTHLDGNAGDGRAPGWVYVFHSGNDGRCIFIILAGGLGVLAEGWEECDSDGMEPDAIPGGVLDSDAVARILEGTDGWPQADEASLAAWELGMDEGSAYWEVYLENETQVAVATLDAMTGDILELAVEDTGTFEGGLEEGLADGGSYASAQRSTSATVVTPATPLSLSIQVGDAATMNIQAVISTSAVGQATLRVVGPGGTILEEGFVGSETFDLADLRPGDYDVSIEHGSIALMPALAVTAVWAE